MKQFINIYIISFVLILSQLSLFSSCKDEDTVAELKLDRTAIQIKEGSEGILIRGEKRCVSKFGRSENI